MELNTLILKNAIWRGSFYLTSIILNIAMVRMLGATLSGQLYFLLNNLSLALLLGSISLESGITYYISKGQLAENQLAVFSALWATAVSVVISSLFFVLYTHNRVAGNDFFFFACVCFCLGNIMNSYFGAFFYTQTNYRTPNLVAIVANLLLLFCIPWTQPWLGFIDTNVFLIIFFAMNILQGLAVCGFWFAKAKYPRLESPRASSLAPALKYGTAALLGNVMYFVLYRIDYWFVEYYCSPKALGNYIQVSRVCQLLILPCVIMAGTLFPESSKAKFSFETPAFRKLAKLIVAGYSLIALGIWILGRPIILFLWGADYDQMYEPLMLTMPGVLFLGISYLFSPTFAGKGSITYNVIISFLSLIVVLIANFVLVPVWGINGAALATTIGFAAMMILYFIFAAVKYQFSFRTLFGN